MNSWRGKNPIEEISTRQSKRRSPIYANKPRTTALRPLLRDMALAGSAKYSPRSNGSGQATHGLLVANLERGSSPR